MNDIQKSQITDMRAAGMGYSVIAKQLDISENTVKSYCRRNGLSKTDTIKPVEPIASENQVCCKNCGKIVIQNDKRKTKQFCNDKCRMAWWNAHRDLVTHKNVVVKECPGCHKSFQVIGKSDRKYCSHACYITDRFGGGSNE